MPDRGNDRARAQRDRFGLYCADALGRAYVSGLLGSDQTAKLMLETGRAIAFAYHCRYDVGRYRCPLSDRRGGGLENVERSMALGKFVDGRLSQIASRGAHVRSAFDDLVLIERPDAGPDWLERLIDNRASAEDMATLARALEGLGAAIDD